MLGCRSITPLSSLNSFDCLLAFDSSPFALAQVVCVSPECRLYIFLKIFSEFLDFSFQRLFLRAGHPLFTSLSIRKKPFCRASRNLFERQFFFKPPGHVKGHHPKQVYCWSPIEFNLVTYIVNTCNPAFFSHGA